MFQPDYAAGRMFELPQAWEVGLLAASEAEEDLVYHEVQAVRGLGLGHTGPASHAFCDIRVLHSGFTLAGRHREALLQKPHPVCNPLKTSGFRCRKYPKMVVNGADELILIGD